MNGNNNAVLPIRDWLLRLVRENVRDAAVVVVVGMFLMFGFHAMSTIDTLHQQTVAVSNRVLDTIEQNSATRAELIVQILEIAENQKDTAEVLRLIRDRLERVLQ